MDTRPISFVFVCALLILIFGHLEAAESPDVPEPMAATNTSGFPLASLLGFANGLEINPKVITETGDKGTTVGLHYKYDRSLTRYPLHKETAMEIKLRSEGLVVVDEDKSPNRLLTHGLRLSAIDLLPPRAIVSDDSPQTRKLIDQLDRRRNNWARALDRIQELEDKGSRSDAEEAELDEKRAVATRTVEETRRLVHEYGVLIADEKTQNWFLRNGEGKTFPARKALQERLYKPRSVSLNFDADADAETDQTFSDVQWVGSAQFSGKVHWPILDFPFELLRGGGPPKNWINRHGGPFFYAGMAAVNASGNESRQAITTEHGNFFRGQFGVSYRTEVFSFSEKNSVALELAWRYYHEFNAPQPLRRKHLDDTSYFKATLLFPGNYFLEYTDGKLPLDVEGASTVSIGWRHNF